MIEIPKARQRLIAGVDYIETLTGRDEKTVLTSWFDYVGMAFTAVVLTPFFFVHQVLQQVWGFISNKQVWK
jgi:hypothetical protein